MMTVWPGFNPRPPPEARGTQDIERLEQRLAKVSILVPLLRREGPATINGATGFMNVLFQSSSPS